jgi:hypothetical protein
MRLKEKKVLEESYLQCDLTSGTHNFYVYTSPDSRLLIHNCPNIGIASDYHGQAFVFMKHAFRKDKETGRSVLKKEKVAFTKEDLPNVSDTPEVQYKLGQLLEVAKEIGIPKDEIWSGDFLFSNRDLKKGVFEGIECLYFQPNTIVYAIPAEDPLAQRIASCKFGAAWHTRYRGEDFDHLDVDFDVNIDRINELPDVFQIDANLPSIAGRVTLTEEETKYADAFLSAIQFHLKVLTETPYYKKLIANGDYKALLNEYRNYSIRKDSQTIRVQDFFAWVSEKFDKKIAAMKTEKGQASWRAKKEEILNFLQPNELQDILNVQSEVVTLKEAFIQKLNKLSSFKTYLQYRDLGYLPANSEGYAVSDIDGNVQKLVSRLEFSKANFSPDVIKGWDSEKRTIKESQIKKFKEDLELDKLEMDNLVKEVSVEVGVENKKDSKLMPKSKKALYTLKPSDGGKRVSKAIDFHQNLEGRGISNELIFDGGDGGTTPEITFDQGELTAEIQFKPVSGGAEITADDEEFWAFVIAALTCHREDLIPKNEHGEKGMDTFDYEGIKGGRAGELENYIEGSKELIKNIFLPDTPYILFREDRIINLTGQGSYTQSLHTLINKAAGEIRGPGFKKDSWNPSDIVACVPQAYEEFVKEWNSKLTYAEEGLVGSFDMFNATLKNYLASREVIGISLKKISDVGKIHIEKVNMKESEDELNSPASHDREVTYRCTRYPSIDLRSESEGGLVAGIQIEADLTNPDETLLLKYKTGGGTTLQLEGTIAKQSAKLGKCPKFLLGDLLREYGVRLGRESSYAESKDLMQGFADIDGVSIDTRIQVEKLKDEIQEIINCEGLNLKADGTLLSVESLEALARKKPENISDEIAQAMWPRIIDFLDLLAKAKNAGNIDTVIRRLYKGAKKEFESCAPFIKVW